MADFNIRTDNDSPENEEESFLPRYSDMTAFTKAALCSIVHSTKHSNELPSAGDDFDYYSSFESFRQFMDVEGTRLLHLAQQVIKYHGAKGNITTNSDAVEIEDKFDILVDANDQILERASTFLDEAAGLRKTGTPLVVSTATPKQNISGSWNKKTSADNSTPKSMSYRLLSAKFIQRPQLKFREKIDNSDKPFVPKITYKPNAKKTLAESMRVEYSTDDSNMMDLENFRYPHPYQFELDHFTPTPRQLKKSKPQEPKSLEETDLTMINTEAELDNLCRILKDQTEIAVDLEHHSYRSFQGITCLMQISTRRRDFIIDTLELRSSLHLLNEIFTDPTVIKVFHGADKDVEWLQRDFGLYVVNMFDTGQASRVMNFQRYSLSHLLQYYCQVQADKQYQLADWRIRPLPDELVNYARCDTHYLLCIYDRMKNELIERGNNQNNLLLSVITRSKDVCAKRYEKPKFTKESYLELYRKTKKVFNSQQLAALCSLHEWKDKIARSQDESTGYVLPNHMMLQISEILPREPQGILACCNPTPPIVRQNLSELHQMVKTAREKTRQTVTTSTTMKPTLKQHPKYNVDNLLHWPHDLSHADKLRELDNPSLTDPSLVAASASMFSNKTDMTTSTDIPIRESPIISAFSWPKPKQQLHPTSSMRRAAAIKAELISPFELYMPHTLLKKCNQPTTPTSSNNEPTTSKSAEKVTPKWKLLPNTPIETSKPKTKRKTPTKLVGDEDFIGAELKKESEEQEEALPLRVEPKSKRKLVEGSIPDKQGQTVQEKKQKKHSVSFDSLEDEGFIPHDYSQADYSLFQSKDTSKKPQNIYGGRKDYGSKGSSKSRKGKSYTYSKKSKADRFSNF